MRFTVFALLLVAAVVGAELAPLFSTASPKVIRGSYLVTLKEGTTEAQRDAHIAELSQAIDAAADAESKVGYRWHIGSFIGFAAKMSDVILSQERASSLVKFIEADQEVQAFIPIKESTPIKASEPVPQPGATWGLVRTSQRALALTAPYVYPSTAGEDVTVYVLDTGIQTTHNEFQSGGVSRATFGATFTGETNYGDLNGHGTHCAGTIAGNIYGVAKKAKVVAVQVLSQYGSGSWEGVIAGINWVAANAAKPAVASMSLGGGVAPTVDAAVAAAIETGIPFAIAAGNSNANSCSFSPARVPTAVTVGSTANNDARSSFSNFGNCTDIFAPGTSITAAWIGSNSAINTISGTSMATPHVAGVIALTLSQNPQLTPAQVTSYLATTSTKGFIQNVGVGSPNNLLYSPADPVYPPRV